MAGRVGRRACAVSSLLASFLLLASIPLLAPRAAFSLDLRGATVPYYEPRNATLLGGYDLPYNFTAKGASFDEATGAIFAVGERTVWGAEGEFPHDEVAIFKIETATGVIVRSEILGSGLFLRYAPEPTLDGQAVYFYQGRDGEEVPYGISGSFSAPEKLGNVLALSTADLSVMGNVSFPEIPPIGMTSGAMNPPMTSYGDLLYIPANGRVYYLEKDDLSRPPVLAAGGGDQLSFIQWPAAVTEARIVIPLIRTEFTNPQDFSSVRRTFGLVSYLRSSGALEKLVNTTELEDGLEMRASAGPDGKVVFFEKEGKKFYLLNLTGDRAKPFAIVANQLTDAASGRTERMLDARASGGSYAIASGDGFLTKARLYSFGRFNYTDAVVLQIPSVPVANMSPPDILISSQILSAYGIPATPADLLKRGIPQFADRIVGVSWPREKLYAILDDGRILAFNISRSAAPVRCSCRAWRESGCGISPCSGSGNYMLSMRDCVPKGCQSETTCDISLKCAKGATTTTTKATTTTTIPPLPNVTTTIPPTTVLPTKPSTTSTAAATTTTAPVRRSCPPTCNDNNACTTDDCSAATGYDCAYLPLPAGTACGNGFACTASGACAEAARRCPECPVPAQWSECTGGRQQRQAYSCGIETAYYCVPTVEARGCAVPMTTTSRPSCSSSSSCGPDQVCIAGSCSRAKLVLAFVPLNWQGDEASFYSEVDARAGFLLDNLPLVSCKETVRILPLWTNCTAPVSCESCSELSPIRDCARRFTTNYNVAVGITDQEGACGVATRGFSCRLGTIFMKKGFEDVLAHEFGHEFGLRDEYCDYGARCGGQAKPNPLSAEWGCDPANSDCCWCRNAYGLCCYGNKNQFGGRSIMSYAGAPGPKAYDPPSFAHLSTFEKLRC